LSSVYTCAHVRTCVCVCTLCVDPLCWTHEKYTAVDTGFDFRVSAGMPRLKAHPQRTTAGLTTATAAASAPSAAAPRARKKQRAIDEIRKYQRSVKRLIPLKPFCLLVREVATSFCTQGSLRWKPEAIEALQEVCVHVRRDAHIITSAITHTCCVCPA
jgi:histone H3/H4